MVILLRLQINASYFQVFDIRELLPFDFTFLNFNQLLVEVNDVKEAKNAEACNEISRVM